jgi:hypothetical protein
MTPENYRGSQGGERNPGNNEENLSGIPPD